MNAIAPRAAYWLVAAAVLGPLAWLSAHNTHLQGPHTDIWQHAAALRALIADPVDPASPFVAGAEGSRHFQPLWLLFALLARGLGLDVWQVLALASYGAMALLAAGIYCFARVYFRQVWAPLVLLVVFVFGWVLPAQHTGFISAATLVYAAPYPATYLVALGLLLWALTILALENRRRALAGVPVLVALMMMVHQLGAVIGLIAAGWFVLCWPKVALIGRVWVALALVLGVGLSQLWPYHSPLALIFAQGHSNWQGGPNFFGPVYIAAALLPAGVGVLGLCGARGRALLLAALTYLGLFALGYTGAQVAGRFLMPAALVLQIGLAGYLLGLTGRRARVAGVLGAACVSVYVLLGHELGVLAKDPSLVPVYPATAQLLHGVPAQTIIAAHDLAAWPVVALGYRVVSVPWPEPLITDLAARQALTAALFDPALTAAARGALAQQAGTSVLIADARLIAPRALAVLRAQAAAVQVVGDLYRFDLPRADQATP